MKILREPHVIQQYNSDSIRVRFGIYLFLGPPSTPHGHRMENLNILMKDTYFICRSCACLQRYFVYMYR